MKLRGIDFGHVLDASGARGWFGEGYPFHKLGRPFGLRFDGSTFVAKTTTLHRRDPNRALRRDGLTPHVLTQRNVKIRWRKGVVLNALGLPGPGVRALLDLGQWQRIREPFFLSFMAVGASVEESRTEVAAFGEMLQGELPRFAAPVGLQVNVSCPNVTHRDHLREFREHLREYQKLNIPIMVKLSATTSPEAARDLAELPGCDALCISNSIPWGEFPDRIDWTGLYGRTSPLAAQGGGGLSGAPLLRIVEDWVRRIRALGVKKPINAGGGILGPSDVNVLFDAGASSVFVGSIGMLRSWRLQRTIAHANRLFAGAHDEGRSVGRLPASVGNDSAVMEADADALR